MKESRLAVACMLAGLCLGFSARGGPIPPPSGAVVKPDWHHCDTTVVKYLGAADSLQTAVNKEKKWQDSRDMTVKVDYSEDATGDTSVARLNLKVTNTRGNYPGQFRLSYETGLRYDGSDLTEEINRLLLNYDYYLYNVDERFGVESYCFTERFANSYLSLAERYEIGFGLKIEFAGPSERQQRKLDTLWEHYKSRRDAFATKPDTLVTRQSEYEEAKKIAGRRNRIWESGLALSVFKELESTKSADRPFGDTSVTIPAQTDGRFRIVLRPSLSCRPTSRVALSGYTYFKLPFGKPAYVRADSSNTEWLDYRMDGRFELRLDLGEEEGVGFGNASMVFEFDYSEDNAPPFVEIGPSAIVRLERIYRAYSLGIEIKI